MERKTSDVSWTAAEMNNVEIEDFYHQDFTTASEWEVFVARLEEILQDWKLCRRTRAEPALRAGDFVGLAWQEKSEKFCFADVEFRLTHLKLETADDADVVAAEEDEEGPIQCQIDAFEEKNDFVQPEGEFLEIAGYYGVREFLVLSPARGGGILDETRIKILMSSLSIAASNSNCDIPMLVQVMENWQKMYFGMAIGKGTCTHFDMVHLKKIPSHCKHLTGLVGLFKQKISEGGGVRADSVTAAIRFTYLLKDWTNATWTQEPPDFDFMQGETLGVAELGKLPFGATFDPVGELQLFATWPQMSSNVVVDSENFSDLDPLNVPRWSAKVKMLPSPACLLGENLTEFLQLCASQRTLADVLGIGVTSFPGSGESPIGEPTLGAMLNFLFPDAEEDSKTPYGDANSYSQEENPWRGVKTCATDSLVWRLAILAAHCTHSLGGPAALAQLWHEFVQEIRFRWECSIAIPGVASGFPDSVRTCLLHQKLQMMNCCIERKKGRETSTKKQQSMEIDNADSESDEEFFECDSEVSNSQTESTKSKYLLWNKPAGRLARHPSLRLLQSGDHLYLPITQDPVPKTEDQLEEDAQVMMQLGTDKYASEMRARLMSASLLSDMESFKAANPGAVLEDFIRWYSPRDWVEDEGFDQWGQPKGHLSPRMMIPKNPWSTTWESAQPVPAHRQKRLFDDMREAEKVMHSLTSKRVGQVAELLLPVLTHAALYTLSEQKQEALPSLPEVVQSILGKLQLATKPIHQKLQLYEEIIRDIEGIEALVAQVSSLQHKLGNGETQSKELTSFLVQLMRGKEVDVPGESRGNIGERIVTMFRDAQKASQMVSTTPSGAGQPSRSSSDARNSKIFPEPACKEFILRAMQPRPSPNSTPQPQRLYACVRREDIRLAGFFSEDTVFL